MAIRVQNENELTQKAEEFKKILDSIDFKHEETMSELKNQYDASLKTIADEFKDYVEGNKNALANVENEIINLETTYDNLFKAEEIKFKKLDSEIAMNKKQLEMLENQFNESIKQIELGYNSIDETEAKKSNFLINKEREEYEKEIRDIQNEIDALDQPKGSLNMKIRDLTTQQSALEDEITQHKQELLLLLNKTFDELVASYRDRVDDEKTKLKEFDVYSKKKINVFKK